MATKNDLIQILKELLLNRFAPKPNYVSGLLGNGVGAVVVPERPDYSYVRFNRSTTQVFEIFNKNVSPVHGWPVLIGELPWQPGLTQVIDTDWGAYEQVGWGDTGPEVSAHGESHEWNDGNPGSDVVNVYTRALVPLRTYSPYSGSTTIYAAPLEYEWNETGTFFPGTPGIDFSDLINSIPTGTQMFAGVYLDPYTNTLGVVTGTQSVYSPAVLPAFPEFPGGVIPSARIRLRGYQVGIAEQNIYDARRLLRPDGSQVGPAGGDLTGTYPNPRVAGLFGYPLIDSAPSEGNVLMFSGSIWRPIPGGQATPTGPAGGDLTGAYPNPQVAGLYGYSLLNTAPSEGDVLMFTGSAWRPTPGSGVGSNTLTVVNSSGATASVGDVGYIDENGEYQTTTTAKDTVTWCVVVIGGADGASIKVTRRGTLTINYTGSAPSAGDWLVTSTSAGDAQAQTTIHPAIFAQCLANGSGGTVEALLLCGRTPLYLADSHYCYGVTGAYDSDFQAQISGTPSGNTLVYSAPFSGNEENIKPWTALDSAFNAKLVLYNKNRVDSLLISSVDLATNTITFTSAVPGTWVNLDTIETRSQLNNAVWTGGAYYFDFDFSGMTTKPDNAVAALFHSGLTDTGGANAKLTMQSYDVRNNAENVQNYTQSTRRNLVPLVVGIKNDRFQIAWDATGAGTISELFLLHIGWVVASP